MNYGIFVFIFSIAIFSNLKAQISIEANTSVSCQKFKINIDENSQNYFITLKILDSISTNKEYENDMEKFRVEYFRLKNNSIKSDSVKSILNKINILTEKNTYYSTFKTEIIKNDYKDFDNLIKLFKSESSEFFEKREKNKNRIDLDGTIVKIDVNNYGKTKTIWSHSPREKSHPEINNLLTSTLDILRNKKILQNDKKNTVGY